MVVIYISIKERFFCFYIFFVVCIVLAGFWIDGGVCVFEKIFLTHRFFYIEPKNDLMRRNAILRLDRILIRHFPRLIRHAFPKNDVLNHLFFFRY